MSKVDEEVENIKEMNIFKKIQRIKAKISERELKMTGHNNFSGYDYYQLSDFLPSVVELCDKYNIFSKINFEDIYDDNSIQEETENSKRTILKKEKLGEVARLTLINIDKPEEKQEYVCDVKELTLKGANNIQNYGGIQTYLRRYLYMNAFDIVEGDMFDSDSFEDNKNKKKNKKELDSLIEIEKKKFVESSDEIKSKVGAQMKTLGYTNFADLSKKQNKSDILSLAEILQIDIPSDLE